MTETSQRPESVLGTASWVFSGLGILLAIATCISIIKNGFSIELHGTPAKVLAQYTWLRDMLFEPVVWVLRYYGLTMPWWLKDIVVAYGLVGAAVSRSYREFDYKYTEEEWLSGILSG